MKPSIIFFICTFFTAVLPALAPGEKSVETRHKLQWLDCAPMPLGKIDPEKHKNIPAYRAVVFMYTRAQDSDRTFAMLENLRRQYSDKLLICAITPDQTADARILRKRHRDARVRLAVDTSRRLTPEFMRGTIMLFPMAFLIDSEGVLLWRGEAVDLPEMMDRLLKGRLSTQLCKKTDPMIYQTQQAMRDGNLLKVWENAGKVLKTDPANPSALRLAIFASEAAGQIGKAWEINRRMIKEVPDLPRLYFTALDLTMRHTELRRELPELIRLFGRQPFAPEIRCAFIDALLNSFSFEADAVLGAKEILAGTPMPLNAQAGQIAMLLAIRGRLHYALGDLDAAASDLGEAVAFLKKSGDRTTLLRAEKQLEFFRTLLKHRKESGK